MNWKKNGALLAFGLIAVAISAMYLGTLSYPYNYDDDLFVRLAPGTGVADFFLSRIQNLPNRALVFATFTLSHWISPNDQALLRLTNIIIHLFASFGVCLLTYEISASGLRMARGRAAGAGCIAALFFATHPVQTQAVTFIWQRCASLTAMFAIWGMWAWFRNRSAGPGGSKKFLFLSLFLLISAVFSKENGLTAIPVILLAEGMLFRTTIAEVRARRWSFIALAAVGLILPVRYLFIGDILVADMVQQHYPTTSKSFFLTQMHVLFKYVTLVLAPVGQTLDYDFPVTASVDLRTILAFFVHLFVVLYGVVLGLKGKLAGFLIVGFYVFLSVEASFIPLTDVIVEHRLYLPMVVPAVGFGVAIAAMNRGRASIVCTVICITGLAVATYSRNKVWASDIGLWEDVIAKAPGKARGHENLGVGLYRRGKLEAALRSFERSFLAGSAGRDSLERILELQLSLGLQDEARRMIDIFPRTQVTAVERKFLLASIERRSGNAMASLAILDEILQLDPGHWEARYEIVFLLLELKRPQLAKEHFSRLDDNDEHLLAMADLNTRLLYAHGDARFRQTLASAESFGSGTFSDDLRIARLAMTVGELAVADRFVKRIWGPDAAPVLTEYVGVLVRIGAKDHLQDVMEDYLKLFPDDVSGIARAAKVLSDAQDWHVTELLLEHLIERVKKTTMPAEKVGELYFNLAIVKYELGERQIASDLSNEAERRGFKVPAEFKLHIQPERF